MSVKEVHNAIVTRNVDDDLGTRLRGAVFFDAPTLFEGEFPLPAVPCFPFASDGGAGMFYVPKVGDEIEIEIEADDETDDTTDVELPEPRWRCMVYSDAADIDDLFKTNYPDRMGWKTNSGHYLLFDDSIGQEFVSLNSQSGHEILLDDAADEITILHKNGTNKIVLGQNKIEIATATDSIVIENGQIISKALIEFNVETEIVKLGSSPGFHATLSENVIGLHDQHFHSIIPIVGPTLTPTVPMSSKAGTPLDPTALRILLKGNV